MCRADARQHQHGRQQRPEFAHDYNYHRRAEIICRADLRQSQNRLPDDEKTQRQRHEQKHRQQPHARAGDFLPDARTDHVSRHAGFSQNDPQRNQGKRAQPLHGEQKQEQLPAQKIRVGFGQRRATKQLRVRQREGFGQIPAHKGSVELRPRLVKKVFPPVGRDELPLVQEIQAARQRSPTPLSF